MSTVTPLLNLVKPASPEQFSLATYNNNLDLIDSRAGVTDKMSKGTVATANNAALSTGLGGVAVLCDYVQASLVAGRLYRVSYKFKNVCSGMASMAIAAVLKKSATTDTTATGIDFDNSWSVYSAPVAGQGVDLYVEMRFRASVTETVNVKAVLARATGTTTFDISYRVLTIDDMGYQF